LITNPSAPISWLHLPLKPIKHGIRLPIVIWAGKCNRISKM
jgi:hypothetical protein